jgi:hypothetical protein
MILRSVFAEEGKVFDRDQILASCAATGGARIDSRRGSAGQARNP